EKDATAVPDLVCLSSGSRTMRPMMNTLLSTWTILPIFEIDDGFTAVLALAFLYRVASPVKGKRHGFPVLLVLEVQGNRLIHGIPPVFLPPPTPASLF